MEPVEVVRAYHERTKHSDQRSARSAGYLDWATQPEPFRLFEGAPVRVLPRDRAGGGAAFDDLFRRGAVPASSLTIESLSDLLLHSLAVSAWKQAGSARWALRVNPSSGNLHPIEGYVVLPPLDGDGPTVRHYRPEEHAVETRAVLPVEAWSALSADLPDGSFLVGLSTIHRREAWKYGERAFRYGQLDTGHAVAAIALSAALQGWCVRLLDTWPTDTVEAMLGLDRAGDFPVPQEREDGELLAVVSPAPVPEPSVPSSGTLRLVAAAEWTGRANRLSPAHVPWTVIDDASRASRHAGGGAVEGTPPPRYPALPPGPSMDARRVIRTRRSGVDFDPKGRLSRGAFLRILDRTLPRDAAPFDVWAHPPRIHLALFVHRVDDLTPGLYAFVRDPAAKDRLEADFRHTFDWVHPEGVPDGFPLWWLDEGDVRALAARLSCTQDIAGDSVASLGMIADHDRALEIDGPAAYRRLFREAGAVGQALYLGAEAEGIRGTGIGCFFDDPVHEVLGILEKPWRSLYHFTFGHAVDDPRLSTLPAYGDDDPAGA